MFQTGKAIPVFFLTAFLLINLVFSKEIIFYSQPPEPVQQQIEKYFQTEFPTRNWIDLTGEWAVKDVASETDLGIVSVPFSYLDKQSFLFEKSFLLAPDAAATYLLHFWQINGPYQIFLNGHLISEGYQNYLPLKIILRREYLEPGENILQVILTAVDETNSRFPAWHPINVPRISQGILSAVYLEVLPGAFIEDIRIQTQYQEEGVQISGNLKLNQPLSPEGNFVCQITVFNGETAVFRETISLADTVTKVYPLPEIQLDNELRWHFFEPEFLFIEAILDSSGAVKDVVRQPLAIRQISTTSREIRLNGKVVVLQGINYVYQNREGVELFNSTLAENDLHWIKEQGFNAIRVVMHPLPEAFYYLCDRMGILCFQDLPYIFTATEPDTLRLREWQQYLFYMNNLADRHPAIAGIGVGFAFDAASGESMEYIIRLLSQAPEITIPLYLNSLMATPENVPVDFQIIELLRRNNIKAKPVTISNQAGQLFLPSGFSKAISYRMDATTVTHDVLQLREAYLHIRKQLDAGKIPGHFIPTYSDFYLNFPSLQNGGTDNLYLNTYGIKDLNRNPRPILTNYKEFPRVIEQSAEMTVSEARSALSYLYIIIGLFNLFFFFLFYQKFKEFRQNLHYTFRKPHGFFINLKERIIIPHGQSLVLLLFISVNGAIVYSSIAFYFRNNLIFDYLLSMLFFNPNLKLFISRIIWNQAEFLLITTACIFLYFYLLAIFIKILSLSGANRVPLKQALAVSIWSAVPFILLLPLGAFLYNLLLTMKSYWILLGVLLYFHVWFYLRWINGTRVITEHLYLKTFAIFTLVFLALAGMLFIFYQSQIHFTDHLKYLYHLYRYNI